MTDRPILFSAPMVRALLEGRKTQTRRICKPQPIDVVGSRRRRMYSDEDFKKSWQTVPGCLEGDGFVDCPYGRPGDRLWVRETHMLESNFGIDGPEAYPPPFKDGRPTKHEESPDWGKWWTQAHYAATDPRPELCRESDADRLQTWRPSIHMPRWASRITLEITGVRVERLREISEADAKAEGLSCLTKDKRLYKYGIPDRDGLPGNDDDGWHWQEWETDPRNAYHRLWEQINGPGSAVANPWVWVIEFQRVAP